MGDTVNEPPIVSGTEPAKKKKTMSRTAEVWGITGVALCCFGVGGASSVLFVGGIIALGFSDIIDRLDKG